MDMDDDLREMMEEVADLYVGRFARIVELTDALLLTRPEEE